VVASTKNWKIEKNQKNKKTAFYLGIFCIEEIVLSNV
jgi:hypothetical protein